jgi:hypothetical protein
MMKRFVRNATCGWVFGWTASLVGCANGPTPQPALKPADAVAIPLGDAPEDIFQGQIIVIKVRLPSHFPSKRAFVSTLRSSQTSAIWRGEDAPDGTGAWAIEYVAFFAKPIAADQVRVTFYEDVVGRPRFVADDSQNLQAKGSRIFASSVQLSQPEFQGFRRYRMTLHAGTTMLASTTIWLLEKVSGFRFAIGPFGAQTGAAGINDDAAKVVHDTIASDLANVSGVVPEARIGFYIDGKVTRLEEAVDRGVPVIACDARAEIVFSPSKHTFAWTTAAATVTPQRRGRKADRRDCLQAKAHQIADDLRKLFASFTATPRERRARATPFGPSLVGESVQASPTGE